MPDVISQYRNVLRKVQSYVERPELDVEIVQGRENRLHIFRTRWLLRGVPQGQVAPSERVPDGVIAAWKVGGHQHLPELEPGWRWMGYTAPIDIAEPLLDRVATEHPDWPRLTTSHPERRIYYYIAKREAIGVCRGTADAPHHGRPAFAGDIVCRTCGALMEPDVVIDAQAFRDIGACEPEVTRAVQDLGRDSATLGFLAGSVWWQTARGYVVQAVRSMRRRVDGVDPQAIHLQPVEEYSYRPAPDDETAE